MDGAYEVDRLQVSLRLLTDVEVAALEAAWARWAADPGMTPATRSLHRQLAAEAHAVLGRRFLQWHDLSGRALGGPVDWDEAAASVAGLDSPPAGEDG